MVDRESETQELLLVVDDQEDIRALLTLMLHKAGYKVISSNNGEDALVRAAADQPDVILLDVNMPGLDGFATCRRLKAMQETAAIPVIFVSARDDTADKVQGLRIGGTDYVTKPFEKAEVLARVQAQLKIRRLTNELTRRNQELSQKQRHIEEELRTAAAIQQSLFSVIPEAPAGLQLAWQFLPCESLGGDIFNVIFINRRFLALYMVDVSGHGVPSALVTLAISQSLSLQGGLVATRAWAHAHEGIVPQEPITVVAGLEKQYPFERFDRFFTLFYALVDLKTGTCQYYRAGHPPAILLTAAGDPLLLENGGPMIGLGLTSPPDQGAIHLKPGDRLILYTDGLTECFSPEGDIYSTERLTAYVRKHRHRSLADQLAGLKEDVMAFGGGRPLLDDVTLLGLEMGRWEA